MRVCVCACLWVCVYVCMCACACSSVCDYVCVHLCIKERDRGCEKERQHNTARVTAREKECAEEQEIEKFEKRERVCERSRWRE